MGLQMQAEKKRRNRRRLSLFKETYQMSTGRPNTEDRFAGLVLSALRKRRHTFGAEFTATVLELGISRTSYGCSSSEYSLHNFFPLRNTLSDRLDGIVGRR